MDKIKIDLDHIKQRMLRKYPSFGATIANVKYEVVHDNKIVGTAATDGTTIYVSAKFMAGLSEDQQVFILAHEICHIALQHLQRSQGKDPDLWNIATDAVINQHLKQDGLPIPAGGVDMADALQYDAEALYEKLCAEKKQNQAQNEKDDKRTKHQAGHDSHALWAEGLKKLAEQKQPKQSAQKAQSISETDIFQKNQQEKINRAKEIMDEINQARRGLDGKLQKVALGNVGTALKPVVNWKKMLVRTLEIEDEAWGHRFSYRTNGYAARIEDVEYDEKAETEIILDVSSSVSTRLLKDFLRQVKTVLKNSTIKVGTFSNNFHGFITIKKEAEIDNLQIQLGGGTNFDAASRAFTKRKDVNKICFTDGEDGGATEISEKRSDIVWISFKNPDFKPDNGKVIYVPQDQIQLINQEGPERSL